MVGYTNDILFNESRFLYLDLFPKHNSSLSPIKNFTLPPLSMSTISIPSSSSIHTDTQQSASPSISTIESSHLEDIQFSSCGSFQFVTVDGYIIIQFLSVSFVISIPPMSVNSHHMQIRVKSGFSQPRLEPIPLLTHPEPKNVKHALADFKWKFAMRTEICQFMIVQQLIIKIKMMILHEFAFRQKNHQSFLPFNSFAHWMLMLVYQCKIQRKCIFYFLILH